MNVRVCQILSAVSFLFLAITPTIASTTSDVDDHLLLGTGVRSIQMLQTTEPKLRAACPYAIELGNPPENWRGYRSGASRPNPIYQKPQGERVDGIPQEFLALITRGALAYDNTMFRNVHATPDFECNIDNFDDFFASIHTSTIRTKNFGSAFMMDARQKSRLCVALPNAIISTMLAAFAGQGDVPIIVVSIGNTFGFEVAGPGSRTILGLVTATTTPAYGNECYESIQQLLWCQQEQPLKRFRYQTTLTHKGSKVLVLANAAFTALLKGVTLYTIENPLDDPVPGGSTFFYVVGGPNALNEFFWRLKTGLQAVDRVFYDSYTTQVTSRNMREILKTGVQDFLNRMGEDQDFTEQIYSHLRESIFKPFKIEDCFGPKFKEQLIELTALFLVHGTHRYEEDYFAKDLEHLRSQSAGRRFFSYFNDLLKGAASLASYAGASYTIQTKLLERWFTPSTTIKAASQVMGGVYALGQGFFRFITPERSYTSLVPWDLSRFKVFKALGSVLGVDTRGFSDYRWTRTVASWSGLVSAALHVWWPVFMSAEALDATGVDIGLKVGLLAPLAKCEFTSYNARFGGNWQDMITNYMLRQMKLDDASLDQKRALFRYLGTRLIEEVDRATPQTIASLYDVAYACHIDQKMQRVHSPDNDLE